MGTIADTVHTFWEQDKRYPIFNLAQAIDSEFESLRQEIQDLKMDNIRGGSISSPDEQPTPEPELQRGDFVSYIWKSKDKKVWGVFHHQDGNDVEAYWQSADGSFRRELTFMPRDRVTFEFRPEK